MKYSKMFFSCSSYIFNILNLWEEAIFLKNDQRRYLYLLPWHISFSILNGRLRKKYRYQYTYIWSNVTTNNSLTSKIYLFITFSFVYSTYNDFIFGEINQFQTTSILFNFYRLQQTTKRFINTLNWLLWMSAMIPFIAFVLLCLIMNLNKRKTNYSAFNKVLLVIFSRKIMIWFGSIPSGQVTL